MGADGVARHNENLGDVAGRVPVGELLEHFRLARRQPRERRDGRFPMIISPRCRLGAFLFDSVSRDGAL